MTIREMQIKTTTRRDYTREDSHQKVPQMGFPGNPAVTTVLSVEGLSSIPRLGWALRSQMP